jgi:hypothetical protein
MAPRHEYWNIIEGQVHLSIDGLALELIESDIAIVRGGDEPTNTRRWEGADDPGARVIIDPPLTMRRQEITGRSPG